MVNDALRKIREMETEIDAIRAALIAGEASGISNRAPDNIINAVMGKRRRDGAL